MGEPEVSVVTATYDSADYVERALESVRNQTIDDARLEHVVVDDGSTDETVSLVEAFDAPSLRFIRTERNSGPWRTVNRGIDAARGDYLVVLDSDDEFCPGLIERMADVLRNRPDTDYVYSDYLERSPDGERVEVDTGDDVLDTVAVGVMHRTDHLERFGGYDPEMIHAEYDLLLQYREAGLSGYHIPEPLFVYHRRTDSQSADSARVAAGLAELREKFGSDVDVREY